MLLVRSPDHFAPHRDNYRSASTLTESGKSMQQGMIFGLLPLVDGRYFCLAALVPSRVRPKATSVSWCRSGAAASRRFCGPG